MHVVAQHARLVDEDFVGTEARLLLDAEHGAASDYFGNPIQMENRLDTHIFLKGKWYENC